MAENRRLLIALAVVLLVGVVVRFGLPRVRPTEGVYYADLPDETPSFRAIEVYVCPKCLEALFQAMKKRAHDEAAQYALSNFGLYYREPGENGCCIHHPDQPLTKTTEIPVHPNVVLGLAEDTEYINRIYIEKDAPDDRRLMPIQVTVVISAKDRRSIHRAESCLKGQGWAEHSQGFLTVKSESVPSGELTVRHIVMERVAKDERNRPFTDRIVVLYWYAALPERVTASEYKRHAMAFYDCIIKGVNYRWSYVLVQRRVNPNGGNPVAVSQKLEKLVTEITELATKGTATP